MQECHIAVSKTARYYLLGEPVGEPFSLWFVCHGYGQLADKCIERFKVLNPATNLVVAPEGLHRFYREGFHGNVGAAWMTKEDRLNDIKDYVAWLEQLYDHILAELEQAPAQINVVGFSQGAATVSRWICNGKSKADNLILWSGVYPPDMNLEVNREVLNALNFRLVIGDKDELIDEKRKKEQLKVLEDNGIDYELLEFQGGHDICAATLKDLASML